MVSFRDVDGEVICLRFTSIDGVYINYSKGYQSWYAIFYLRGHKYSYHVSEETAKRIQEYFYAEREVEL